MDKEARKLNEDMGLRILDELIAKEQRSCSQISGVSRAKFDTAPESDPRLDRKRTK